jgi:hypothetical protein
MVELYLSSPVRVHGVVLNSLSAGTILLLAFTLHLKVIFLIIIALSSYAT